MSRSSGMRFLLLSLLVLLPTATFAHVNGASFETTVDGYLIDSGYSNPAPTVGESVLFDFRLRKGDVEVPFDDVWVKIESEDKAVVFAGGLHNLPVSGPRMSYVFPRAGNYTVDFRYERATGPVVESSYPLTVIPATSNATAAPALVDELYALGGFVAGAVLVLILKGKRRTHEETEHEHVQ